MTLNSEQNHKKINAKKSADSVNSYNSTNLNFFVYVMFAFHMFSIQAFMLMGYFKRLMITGIVI